MSYKKGEQPSLSVLLCYPFLNKITKKSLIGKPYARAIDLVDVQEQLYSIGAAVGHVLRNKLDILVKLLSVPGAKEYEADRLMSLCKKDARKNFEEFINEFGREPDTFGEFISYRNVEKRLRNAGIRLSAKDAVEAYAHGDKKIRKIFDEKVDLEGIERIMMPPLLQGIQFGSSFPELTEKMYQKACKEDNGFWAHKGLDDLVVPKELKPWNLEETQRAVLQMVAAYTSEYYPELLDPLDLRGYLAV